MNMLFMKYIKSIYREDKQFQYKLYKTNNINYIMAYSKSDKINIGSVYLIYVHFFNNFLYY